MEGRNGFPKGAEEAVKRKGFCVYRVAPKGKEATHKSNAASVSKNAATI